MTVKATHRLTVCDTYDYEDYIVMVHEGEDFEEVRRKYDGVNMQRIHNVESYDHPIVCTWWTCAHNWEEAGK
jgi:hypothetical protein